jgi:phage terminase large subunit GpA-like protein
MIDNGMWVPAGQRVNKRGQLLGEPERSPRVTGYNATSMIGKHVTFGKIAAEYCRSHGDPKKEQNFVNNWLGEKYVARAKAIRWKDLHPKLIGGHPRGSVPPSAYFLTAGIDKQKDRAYWSVRAWGSGKTSWLVDWGVISQSMDENGAARQASDLQRVWSEVILRDYPVVGGANVMGWPTLRVVKAGCDTQYRPLLVWNWVRQLPGDIVRAFAGDHAVLGPYRRSVVEQNSRTGEPYPDGGMVVWRVNTAEYKSDIRDRWKSSQSEPGFWWTSHTKLEEIADYLQHLTNEVEISKPTPKNPQATIWQPSDMGMRWDWWDTEVYSSAAADMVTGHEWANLRALCEPLHTAPAPEPISFENHTEWSAR